MKIALKLSEYFGFLPVPRMCRHFTIAVFRFHSMYSSLCPYPLPLPSNSFFTTAARMIILNLDSESVTLLLKKCLMASQPKSVNCSQGPAQFCPTSSSPAAYPSQLSHGTIDSQFLKCTEAHVHPAVAAWKALLNFSTLTPPLQPSDLRASISSSGKDSSRLPLTMPIAPWSFPVEHITRL